MSSVEDCCPPRCLFCFAAFWGSIINNGAIDISAPRARAGWRQLDKILKGFGALSLVLETTANEIRWFVLLLHHNAAPPRMPAEFVFKAARCSPLAARRPASHTCLASSANQRTE